MPPCCALRPLHSLTPLSVLNAARSETKYATSRHTSVWARATSGGGPQRAPLLTGDRPHVVPSAVGSRAHVGGGEGASSERLPSTQTRTRPRSRSPR
eukprot:scaffold6204_cov56-Phaeocystis_antarctica.AAC.5